MYFENGWVTNTWYEHVVVVYPHPWPLLVGESDFVACGPSASFSVHLDTSPVTPAVSGHKSRGDNVVRMWVCS